MTEPSETRDLRPLVTGLATLAIAGAIVGEPLVLERLRLVLAGLCAVVMLAAWAGTARLGAHLLIGGGPLLGALAFALDAARPGDVGLAWTPVLAMLSVLVGGGLLVLLLDGPTEDGGLPDARARRRRG